MPNQWDAWDIDAFYHDTVRDLIDAGEVAAEEKGPSRAAVRVIRSFGSSTVTQVLAVPAGERRLDVDTEVGWYERETLLKAAFPLDVHADRFAPVPARGRTRLGRRIRQRLDVRPRRDPERTGRPGHDDGTADPAAGAPVPRPGHRPGGAPVRYALVPGARIADAVREGYRINLPLRQVRGAPVAALASVDHESTA